MTRTFSKTLAYLLHPVFIPSILVIMLKYLAPLPVFFSFLPPKLFNIILITIFCYTAVLPLGFMFFQKQAGNISNFQLSERKERPKILIFIVLLYFVLAYFLIKRGNVFMPISVLIASMGINITGLVFMSYFDKISIHASGWAGILGIFTGLYIRYQDPFLIPVVLILLVILGILGSTRLFLGAHNLRQVSIGSIWGFLTGFVAVFYFMRF